MVNKVGKFKLGSVVMLSALAIERKIFKKLDSVFVVVGFCRDADCVSVVKVGNSPKSRQTIHVSYLEFIHE